MSLLALSLSVRLVAGDRSGCAGRRTAELPESLWSPSSIPAAVSFPNATVKVTPQDPAAVKARRDLVHSTAADDGRRRRHDRGPAARPVHDHRRVLRASRPSSSRTTASARARTSARVTLPIKKVAEDVVVGRDKQTAGLDPRGNAFSTVLTREQIAALPDDPDEMEATLKAMSPPGAVMRVDGFTGGKLPPKSQIRSIRLPRMDQMAAQNHGGINGMMHIDVMTQPGSGPIAGSFDCGVPRRRAECEESVHAGERRGGAAGRARSRSTDRSCPTSRRSRCRCSRRGMYDTGNILAAVPDGNVIASPIRRPGRRTNINARFDQSISSAHLMKFSYQRSGNDAAQPGRRQLRPARARLSDRVVRQHPQNL